MRLNTPHFQTNTPMGEQMGAMHLLSKQRDAGRENDNCVRLKLAKNTLRRVYDKAHYVSDSGATAFGQPNCKACLPDSLLLHP